MIRKLLATTALASIIATGAYAQGTTTPATETPAAASDQTAAPAAPEFDYVQKVDTDQYLESNLVGQTVYGQGSEDASGEIDNYLIGADGKVAAVIVDTGSILDEAKIVAVPADKIAWAMSADNELRATLTATREELMAAPAFTETTAVEAAETGTATPAPATTSTDTAASGSAPVTGETAPAAGGTEAKPMDSAEITDDSGYTATVGGDQYLSQTLVGSSVYAGPSADAETVGSINDLVVSKDGDVVAAVIGVGGFLGIGEKNVGVPFAELNVTRGDDNAPRAILAANKEQLTAAPTFDTESAEVAEGTAATTGTAASSTAGDAATSVENAGAAAGAAVGSAADATATAANEATDTADTAATSGTAATTDAAGTAEETTASTGGDRAGMTPVTGPELTADNLVGTTVYGPNDASIGSVGDIALSADGQVDAIIVDVGGFLGIGQKQVAVAMDNLQFMKDSGGSMYLYTQFSEDQLKNAPEYNSDTYAQNRDSMRLSPGDAPAAGAGDAAATPAPAQ